MDSLLALLRPRFGARVETLRNEVVYTAVRDALARGVQDVSIYDLLDDIERRDGALWPALARTILAYDPHPEVVKVRRRNQLRQYAGQVLVFCVDAANTRSELLAALARNQCELYLDEVTESGSQLAWAVLVAHLALKLTFAPPDSAARRLALEVSNDQRRLMVETLRSAWQRHPGTSEDLADEITGTRQVELAADDSPLRFTSGEFRSVATLLRRADLRERDRSLDLALIALGTTSFPVVTVDEAKRRVATSSALLSARTARVLDRHVAELAEGNTRRYVIADAERSLRPLSRIGVSLGRGDWRMFVEGLSQHAFALSVVRDDTIVADFLLVRLVDRLAFDARAQWHVQTYVLGETRTVVAETSTDEFGHDVLARWNAKAASRVNALLLRLTSGLESLLDSAPDNDVRGHSLPPTGSRRLTSRTALSAAHRVATILSGHDRTRWRVDL